MTTGKSLTSRRGLGGFATLIGGALMIVSVFLPWLGTQGETVTGWETYDTLADAGRNGFYENNFFDPGFSPFFPGVTVLIAGGLLALIGLAMMASTTGGAFRLPTAGATALSLLAVLIFVVGIVDIISLYVTGPGSDLISAEYGLFLVAAGAVVGVLGVTAGAGKGKS